MWSVTLLGSTMAWAFTCLVQWYYSFLLLHSFLVNLSHRCVVGNGDNSLELTVLGLWVLMKQYPSGQKHEQRYVLQISLTFYPEKSWSSFIPQVYGPDQVQCYLSVFHAPHPSPSYRRSVPPNTEVLFGRPYVNRVSLYNIDAWWRIKSQHTGSVEWCSHNMGMEFPLVDALLSFHNACHACFQTKHPSELVTKVAVPKAIDPWVGYTAHTHKEGCGKVNRVRDVADFGHA